MQSGSYAGWYLPLSGYTIQSGDKISWRQYQTAARGGIGISFVGGGSTNWSTEDTDGQVMNSDTTEGAWHERTVDLTPFAGKSVNHLWITADAATPVGSWSILYGEIAIYSADGTVTPIYDRQPSAGLSYFTGGGETNTQAAAERSNTTGDAELPGSTTTYYVADQIGSTRMLLAAGGWPVSSDTYYPYGVEQYTSGDTNHYKFIGKERDSESGLDYFGARYYASTMERFMSPDPIKITEDRVANPNTLNLYSYAANNPLKYVDPDGQDITYFYDQGGIAGHAVIFAYNQQTGDGAIESFVPIIHSPMAAGESMFDLGPNVTADQLRQTYAALTIQTSPELAQQVIDYIRSNPDPDNWKAWGPNCSTQCAKILQKFKLEMSRDKGKRPKLLWNALKQQYNPNAPAKPTGGLDYGAPRRDMFGAFWNQIQQNWKDDPIEGTPKKNTAPPCLKDRNTGNCV